MHNCKTTRSDLIEVVLSRADQNPLPSELEACAACCEEFLSLRNSLRVTDAALQMLQPPESFWGGYHERLRERLESNPYQFHPSLPLARVSLKARLYKFATASVPVPAPLALAVFAFIAFSICFMIYSRQSSSVALVLAPPDVTKTIEVPVVQEKLVTRVVYKSARRTPPESGSPRLAPRQAATVMTAQSLEGFKPANEVKLTIIKGSHQDEK